MTTNAAIQSYSAALTLASLSILGLQLSIALAQGSLTPPGPPGLTMRTLQQIEPHTPVDNANTPGNFLAQHIISQPASYYLPADIVGVSGKRGIQIQAGNVTLDLNGFSLRGVAGTLQGIYLTSTSTTNVIVLNGIIAGWSGSAVYYTGRNGLMDGRTIQLLKPRGLRWFPSLGTHRGEDASTLPAGVVIACVLAPEPGNPTGLCKMNHCS